MKRGLGQDTRIVYDSEVLVDSIQDENKVERLPFNSVYFKFIEQVPIFLSWHKVWTLKSRD